MKSLKILLVLNFIFFQLLLSAQNISPKENISLRNHLSEINKAWSNHSINLKILGNKISFENHHQRIQIHFELLEKLLKQNTNPNLSTIQKNNRFRNLNLLKEYGLQGRFPINTLHKFPLPYFVDSFGTECAVAHLVSRSGAIDLVNQISKENNFTYVEDLKILYPKIQTWAFENGFTVEELAWIQPAVYSSPMPQFIYSVGNGEGTDGHINVMETSPGGVLLYMAGKFTSIDGHSANSIIAWNGNDWHNMGDGVDGEIFEMHWHNSKLHIAGNFKLHGEEEFTSIAYWQYEEWHSLQNGFTGNIYTMETYQDKLYIGGAFQYLNNTEMPFLAFYDDENSTWSNDGLVYENGGLVDAPNVFSVDDTVRCFAVYDEILFVGGDFSTTSPNVEHPNVIIQEVDRLARWFGYIWLNGVTTDMEQINIIEVRDTSLILGGLTTNSFLTMKNYTDENVNDLYFPFSILDDENPSSFHGYFQHSENEYFYGNIKCVGYYSGEGFCSLGNQNGLFNKQVRAAKVFQNNIYFAGDFTEIFEEPFNGLAYSPWKGEPVKVKDYIQEVSPINIYTSDQKLFITYENLNIESTLNLYNLRGQLLKTTQLQKGSHHEVLNLQEWDSDIYVYNVTTEKEIASSGKFILIH